MSVKERGYGRLEAPDPRDANFPVQAALQDVAPAELPMSRNYYLPPNLPLDQGRTGTCVAHAWNAYLHAAPLTCDSPLSPYDLYRKIVLVDEWPDNDFEATAPQKRLQFGTSVRAGAKVLRELGHLAHFFWALSAEQAGQFILSGKGGVVVGTLVYNSMRETRADGLMVVDPTSGVAGGHAWFLYGYNRRTRLFRGLYSYGKTWGKKGRLLVQHDALDHLITNRGEACCAVEQPL
jgi:hypothetical protein